MRTTPFHERTAAANQTQLWHHWAGFLTAARYHHSATFEYFAVRNAVSLFDTSPLFKYRIRGAQAAEGLATLFARDASTCDVGRAQYTAWCDPGGWIIEDGLLLRTADDEFLLTTAEPNLRHLGKHLEGYGVSVSDESDRFGILALQGPHSRAVIGSLLPAAAELPYFGVTGGTIAGAEVVVSRTGYTGDLGYELWVEAGNAISVWDALVAAGGGHNILPMGMQALRMARLDAGLLLIDIDFHSARFAWTDSERESLDELGWSWMARDLSTRTFVGSEALAARREAGVNRWRTVGIAVDPFAYDELYSSQGLNPPKEGVYREGSLSLYDRDYNADPGAEYLGYVTSFMFSPVVKRHIGLAKLPADNAAVGASSFLELTVAHKPQYFPTEVVETPFFEPARKTAEAHRDVA